MMTTNVNNNALKKTRSSVVTQKAQEVAASPQLMVGKEILHFGHPQHPLSQLNLPDRFTCSGCKEHGAGKRYTCPQCDFQLHDFCALAPSAHCRNPFHYSHELVFYSKPVKARFVSNCDVCSKAIKGYAYRCSPCGFQMHPCCSMLAAEMKIATHPHPGHTLKLLPPGTASSDCGECKRRRGGRMYRCSACEYHVHAVCVKDMMNGLLENGHSERKKAGVLATAGRLVSRVAMEFIGGIADGIGEGVGEVFIQNIARSSPTAGTRPGTTPNPNINRLHLNPR